MKNKKILVVGATGRVGREMLSILSEVGVPAQNVVPVASERSIGNSLPYDRTSLEVRSIHSVNFSDYDYVLFSAGSAVSAKYAPKVAESGCIVVDNTSFFRMKEDIPLIVPEINFDALERYNSRIISNPNCSTIQMVMALKPLHDTFGLKEVVVSTYQATSGAGQKGVDELMEQTELVLHGKSTTAHHFKRQIAFNVIPQIDEFANSAYTKEELKMMNETKKILNKSDIIITATCVRVPVIVGHAVSVFARFEKPVDIQLAHQVLSDFSGVKIIDNPGQYEYATPIDCASKNDVYVSRIRKHPDAENAMSFWCVADNVRKGAALNAIQIVQRLVAQQ